MSKNITREIAAYTGRKRPKKDAPPAPVREPAPGAPTPERIAKEAGELAKVVVVPGNAYHEPHVVHRVQLPVDSHRRHFTQAQIDAAEMICRDAIAAAGSQGITANYDGGARSTPGPRSGGVSDRQRDTFIRFCNVYGKLTEDEKYLVRKLVLGVYSERTGRTTPIHEIARELGATYADAASNAKVGLGLLKAVLGRVYEEYRVYQIENRQSRKLTEVEQDNRAKALSSVRPQIKGSR